MFSQPLLIAASSFNIQTLPYTPHATCTCIPQPLSVFVKGTIPYVTPLAYVSENQLLCVNQQLFSKPTGRLALFLASVPMGTNEPAVRITITLASVYRGTVLLLYIGTETSKTYLTKYSSIPPGTLTIHVSDNLVSRAGTATPPGPDNVETRTALGLGCGNLYDTPVVCECDKRVIADGTVMPSILVSMAGTATPPGPDNVETQTALGLGCGNLSDTPVVCECDKRVTADGTVMPSFLDTYVTHPSGWRGRDNHNVFCVDIVISSPDNLKTHTAHDRDKHDCDNQTTVSGGTVLPVIKHPDGVQTPCGQGHVECMFHNMFFSTFQSVQETEYHLVCLGVDDPAVPWCGGPHPATFYATPRLGRPDDVSSTPKKQQSMTPKRHSLERRYKTAILTLCQCCFKSNSRLAVNVVSYDYLKEDSCLTETDILNAYCCFIDKYIPPCIVKSIDRLMHECIRYNSIWYEYAIIHLLHELSYEHMICMYSGTLLRMKDPRYMDIYSFCENIRLTLDDTGIPECEIPNGMTLYYYMILSLYNYDAIIMLIENSMYYILQDMSHLRGFKTHLTTDANSTWIGSSSAPLRPLTPCWPHMRLQSFQVCFLLTCARMEYDILRIDIVIYTVLYDTYAKYNDICSFNGSLHELYEIGLRYSPSDAIKGKPRTKYNSNSDNNLVDVVLYEFYCFCAYINCVNFKWMMLLHTSVINSILYLANAVGILIRCESYCTQNDNIRNVTADMFSIIFILSDTNLLVESVVSRDEKPLQHRLKSNVPTVSTNVEPYGLRQYSRHKATYGLRKSVNKRLSTIAVLFTVGGSLWDLRGCMIHEPLVRQPTSASTPRAKFRGILLSVKLVFNCGSYLNGIFSKTWITILPGMWYIRPEYCMYVVYVEQYLYLVMCVSSLNITWVRVYIDIDVNLKYLVILCVQGCQNVVYMCIECFRCGIDIYIKFYDAEKVV